jgi:hypothetical protein
LAATPALKKSRWFQPITRVTHPVSELLDPVNSAEKHQKITILHFARFQFLSVRKVKAWEHDHITPTEAEWQVLAGILLLDSTCPKTWTLSPESCVGFYTVQNKIEQSQLTFF